MWLLTRPDAPPPARPGVAATSPAAAGQPERPPGVSHLPPADAATTLGNWHYDRQRWPEAVTQYQQALALGKDNPDVRTDLGNCYRFLGDATRALEQYGIAQRQNPQHENSLFNTAGLYSEVLRDPAKAAATWRDFLQRFPNATGASRAREFLAEIERKNADENAALKQFLGGDKPKAGK